MVLNAEVVANVLSVAVEEIYEKKKKRQLYAFLSSRRRELEGSTVSARRKKATTVEAVHYRSLEVKKAMERNDSQSRPQVLSFFRQLNGLQSSSTGTTSLRPGLKKERKNQLLAHTNQMMEKRANAQQVLRLEASQQQQDMARIKKDMESGDVCHYKLLGVETNASLDEVKNAYKRLALLFHPDKNSEKDAKEIFQRLVCAMSVLTCPDARAKYDLERRS